VSNGLAVGALDVAADGDATDETNAISRGVEGEEERRTYTPASMRSMKDQ
jgi:hypothetical protein